MLHQSLSSPASSKRFTNWLFPQHVGPAIRAGKGCPFSDPCAQLTISTACTLVYRKELFWVQPPCHTHEPHALVFCNFANWSQYFHSISDNSCTWVKWFAHRFKNLEWHPGAGQWRQTRLPMMLTVRKLDTHWIKPLMTRSLWLLRTGHRDHKGHRGLV